MLAWVATAATFMLCALALIDLLAGPAPEAVWYMPFSFGIGALCSASNDPVMSAMATAEVGPRW